ncbi:MAG TPA: CHAP domain-containing protein [Ktedonobacteraceae bacterium]|nr:CHAP domain-containing protein [Ktedonobacteraceae bacterium]
MSSIDNSQHSASGLQLPGLVNQLSPTEQLPFPESNSTFPQTTPLSSMKKMPGPFTPAPDVNSSPDVAQQIPGGRSSLGITRQLVFNGSPAVTRQLPDVQTGTLPSVSTTTSLPSLGTTTSLRQPVVIPATGKKSRGTMRPPRGRGWVVSSFALVMMVVITLLTGFVVLPLATGGHLGFNLSAAGDSKLYQNNDPNSNASLVAQAATATAFVQHNDGYDPSSNNGGGTLYTGSGVTPNRFAFGQCTYWADLRYNQLNGHFVDWIGNAYQWYYGAKSAPGWIVSSTPHVPSIIVLQPYVQGAGYYGHVAVVERINSDGSVYASNMNWYANGGWDRESYWTFTPGSGVSFVWHT